MGSWLWAYLRDSPPSSTVSSISPSTWPFRPHHQKGPQKGRGREGRRTQGLLYAILLLLCQQIDRWLQIREEGGSPAPTPPHQSRSDGDGDSQPPPKTPDLYTLKQCSTQAFCSYTQHFIFFSYSRVDGVMLQKFQSGSRTGKVENLCCWVLSS